MYLVKAEWQYLGIARALMSRASYCDDPLHLVIPLVLAASWYRNRSMWSCSPVDKWPRIRWIQQGSGVVVECSCSSAVVVAAADDAAVLMVGSSSIHDHLCWGHNSTNQYRKTI